MNSRSQSSTWTPRRPWALSLAYDPVKAQGDLACGARGIVLLGAGEPIVLCAVDWIGIANEGNDVFRQTLAEAAYTKPSRVAVHTLHPARSPPPVISAPSVCCGKSRRRKIATTGTFAREVLARLKTAIQSDSEAKPVTHIGLGRAEVKEVASNRRILGPDGKVRVTRYTATKDPAVRAEPEGTIDPEVSLISFWNGDAPVAVLSYYACHPQSYYRTGVANPDFPGIARYVREMEVPDALHIHFDGGQGESSAPAWSTTMVCTRCGGSWGNGSPTG